jgi:hypothetical protein
LDIPPRTQRTPKSSTEVQQSQAPLESDHTYSSPITVLFLLLQREKKTMLKYVSSNHAGRRYAISFLLGFLTCWILIQFISLEHEVLASFKAVMVQKPVLMSGDDEEEANMTTLKSSSIVTNVENKCQSSMSLHQMSLGMAHFSSPPASPSFEKMFQILHTSQSYKIYNSPAIFNDVVQNIGTMFEGYGLNAAPSNETLMDP